MIRSLLPLSLVALLAGCPLGFSKDLVEDSNAQVIVTGLLPDELVRLTIDGVRKEAAPFDDAPLVIHLALPVGEHLGELEIRGAGEPRCAEVRLTLADEEDRDAASVDARTAPLCVAPDGDGGPDDGGAEDGGAEDGGAGDDGGPIDGGPIDSGPIDSGPIDGGPIDSGPLDGGPIDSGPERVFVQLEETTTLSACIPPLCDVVTTVAAEGQVSFLELGNPLVSGSVDPADVSALAEDALSPEADLLFAGNDPDCPQPRPGGLDAVHLERRFLEGAAMTPLTEDIDVSGCTTGIAWTLRQRLAFLRSLALGL